MKIALIAASIAGMAAAGLILYLQRRTALATNAGRVVDAASNAYLNHVGDRPAQHAMG